jgi:aspartate racemase
VKIRGHRIELGEIESVVREHPGVAGAAVVASEARPGDVRLVAYYVPQGAVVAPRDLREHCQRKLPKDVVPTAWVALEAIPLTSNGKTDTKALPPPDASAHGEGAEHVAPRDALEEKVAAIWESVLGMKGLSVRDKFFDVGGHSLLAIRLFGRIEQATGVALPLASLVEEGTIEQMAAAIRDRRRDPNVAATPDQAASHLVRIRAHGSRPPLFCVHGAGGNVLNFRDIARYVAPDRPFYGLQAAGVDGMTQPMTSIEAMAEMYLAELRVVQPRGPYYLSGYCGGGLVSYEMAQRLVAAGERVASLVLIDLYRPGVIVIESQTRRWTRAVFGATPSKIVQRLRVKFDRDLVDMRCTLRLRYHLLRGSRVPFELREYWLNECFLRAMADYRVVPYPGKLTILRAREVNAFYGDPGPDLGWASYARGGIDAHDVPGNHHTMTLEPNVQELAGKLELCLRTAEDAAAGSGLPTDPPFRGVAA